jgi:ferredoxin
MVEIPLVTYPAQVLEQHCLNVRHNQAGCARCETVCPAQAIHVQDAAVAVDPERCTGCGLCLHTCPAEVFTTHRWSERTVLTNVVELEDAPVDLFCACHPRPELALGKARSLRIPTCLAAMSPGAWFELGLERRVTARLDACHACPLSAAMSATADAVELANDWLRDAGHDARVACVDHVDESAHVSRSPVLDGAHRRTTRRGFFQSLFAPIKRELDQALDAPDAVWNGIDSPRHTPRLPAWMTLAAQAYVRSARPVRASPAAVWPEVHISEDCAACGSCTEYCPTGALAVDRSDGYTITFLPGACVDCRVCWASCPVGAITRSQSRTRNPFERRVMLRERVSDCAHCGRPAAGERTTCYWCAEEPPLLSILSDARRWLLDAQLINS